MKIKILLIAVLLFIICTAFVSCNDIDNTPHTHIFGEWITVKAADCTDDGLNERYCECGEKEVATIAALGHNEVTDPGVVATCTTDGLTEGSHCSVCDEVLVEQNVSPMLGHTEVIDEAVPATCTTDGLTEGSHCSACGEVLVEQNVVTMLGHTETATPDVAPTCSAEGKTGGTHCSVCGETLVAQSPVAMLDHTVVIDPAVPSTCTTEGKTEGSHCSVCQIVIDAPIIKSKTRHKYENITVLVPATSTTPGTRELSCTTCAQSYIESYTLEESSTSDLLLDSQYYVGEVTTYDKVGNVINKGTGFVYTSDGVLLTNYHLIVNAYSAEFRNYYDYCHDTVHKIDQILAYDAELDLAVLKVDSVFEKYGNICAEYESSVDSEIHSLGYTSKYSGYSGATVTNIDENGGISYELNNNLRFDRVGAPLLNSYNEVIGITTRQLDSGVCSYYALPIKELNKLDFSTPITFAEFYKKVYKHDPYKILADWLTKNANVTEDDYIEFSTQESDYIFSVRCDDQEDISLHFTDYDESGELSFIFEIEFIYKGDEHRFAGSYFEGKIENKTTGKIYAPTFVNSEQLEFITLVGGHWTEDSLKTSYTLVASMVVHLFGRLLEECDVGLTPADFGFYNYENIG